MDKQTVLPRARQGPIQRVEIVQGFRVDAQAVKFHHLPVVQQKRAGGGVDFCCAGDQPARAAVFHQGLNQGLQRDRARIKRVPTRHKTGQHGGVDQAQLGRDQRHPHARQRVLAQVGQQLHVRHFCPQQHKFVHWLCRDNLHQLFRGAFMTAFPTTFPTAFTTA